MPGIDPTAVWGVFGACTPQPFGDGLFTRAAAPDPRRPKKLLAQASAAS